MYVFEVIMLTPSQVYEYLLFGYSTESMYYHEVRRT